MQGGVPCAFRSETRSWRRGTRLVATKARRPFPPQDSDQLAHPPVVFGPIGMAEVHPNAGGQKRGQLGLA